MFHDTKSNCIMLYYIMLHCFILKKVIVHFVAILYEHVKPNVMEKHDTILFV